MVRQKTDLFLDKSKRNVYALLYHYLFDGIKFM